MGLDIQQRPLEVMQGHTDQDKFQQVKGEQAKAAALLAQSKQQVAQPGQTEHTPCYTPHALGSLSPWRAQSPPRHCLLGSSRRRYRPNTSGWEHKHKLRQGCCCQRHPHLPTRNQGRRSWPERQVTPSKWLLVLLPHSGAPASWAITPQKNHVSLEMRRKEQPPFLSIRASTPGGTAGCPFRQARTHPRAS